MGDKNNVRLFVRFEYDDGTHKDLEIKKATVLKMKTDKVVCHIDRLKDGGHLFICAEEVWPDGKRIENIRMVREIKDS